MKSLHKYYAKSLLISDTKQEVEEPYSPPPELKVPEGMHMVCKDHHDMKIVS